MSIARWLLLWGILPAILHAQAHCSVSSGPVTPHLVELYTSEGCSSCPPAEQWLNGLADDADVIPLEFHVDYWDDLGWRDRFSDHRFTVRQQTLAAHARSSVVYTPEVLLDGREWRQWSHTPLPQAADARVALRLDVVAGPQPQALLAVVAPPPDPPRLQGYYALVEGDLVSVVRSGENSGRTLRHAFVVRAFAGPLPLGERAKLESPPDADAANSSLVAFVVEADHGTVVGALRLPLKSCTSEPAKAP